MSDTASTRLAEAARRVLNLANNEGVATGNGSLVWGEAVRELECALSALRRQQTDEAVERRPIMLEMAAADDEHRKWERRWHALQRMYAVERNFADADGRWGLRDFLNYAGQICGYFPPSVTPKTEASEAAAGRIEPSPADVERVARIADELATRWGEQWKAKYKGKPRDSYENGRLAGLSDGAAIVAREIRAALQSPPVEQPAQAEGGE